ncbi:MAG: hypothetical protein JNM39_12450 [Bdellovibrionaceae bacterium]|nr:hypothetical protein [Pseudobdellovibrionaceae bacterium]
MTRRFHLTLILIISLALAPLGEAKNENFLSWKDFPTQLRFGSEMTISSPELEASFQEVYATRPQVEGSPLVWTTPLVDQKIDGIQRSIKQKYKGSKAKSPQLERLKVHGHVERPGLSINYSNGFSMTLFPDPGVLELNHTPSSQVQIEKNIERIQTDYFDEGKMQGLTPAIFTGGGHIHIEVAKLNPVTVRNFLAIVFNSTGLFAGALNEDEFNSIGVAELPQKQKEELRREFAKFDSFDPPDFRRIYDITWSAYNIPLSEESREYQQGRGEMRPQKYHAVSFNSFHALGTLEIRGIRPQSSARAYLKLVKLFVALMQMADKKQLQGERVPLNELKSLKGHPQAILADFDRLLTEAGLKFEDYTEFVLPWWLDKGGEVDRYLEKRPKEGNFCRALLG